MKNSAIEWTHHTFNPWIGCTKVSPGCKNCYAATQDHRWGHDRWGVGKKRGRTSASYWRQPFAWNREAQAAGERRRVFCASLADVFDTDPSIDNSWRLELFSIIRQTPGLDWLLLTKRPEDVGKVMTMALSESARHGGYMASPEAFEQTRYMLINWAVAPPSNVWLGTTVEDQERANERIPELLKIPAAVRFLSCEPLLEAVDLFGSRGMGPGFKIGVDWVIAGGESGQGARPMAIGWARDLRDQCRADGVPFLFKQWGEFDATLKRVGKKVSGRLLDGVQHDGYPTPRAA